MIRKKLNKLLFWLFPILEEFEEYIINNISSNNLEWENKKIEELEKEKKKITKKLEAEYEEKLRLYKNSNEDYWNKYTLLKDYLKRNYYTIFIIYEQYEIKRHADSNINSMLIRKDTDYTVEQQTKLINAQLSFNFDD